MNVKCQCGAIEVIQGTFKKDALGNHSQRICVLKIGQKPVELPVSGSTP